VNRSQCRNVAAPSSAANTTTGGKPSATVCHRLVRSTHTKNQTPPAYAEASSIAVIVGAIGQANSSPVRPGNT
jgi:hypothetical protein